MTKGGVAVVTGAAGALGRAVAQTLAQNGYKVALVDRAAHPGGREELDQLAASLRGYAVAGDISVQSTWTEAMPRIVRELGAAPSVAALVAGGWAGGKPLHEETSDETWRAMMTANLETVHRSLRAVLPAMVEQRSGSVVVVGSRAGDRPATSPRAAAYAASKAAVVALAQAAAAEVLDRGVRVNAVLPSTMDTPANRAAMPKADASKWVSLASAAGVIAFLLSDQARDISGAAVPIYGRA
jgi:NAD(P)-dependent dehydrogenase (short-subunit alcohol dehydrogenase family)